MPADCWPDVGGATVAGHYLRRNPEKSKRIGYMSQRFSLYQT
jgi:ABC-type multidrug transport system ATPase subunit